MGRRIGLLVVLPAVAVAVACESFDSSSEPPVVVDAGGAGDAGALEAGTTPEAGVTSGACDPGKPFGVAEPVAGLPGDGMVSAGLTEDELQIVYASDGDVVDPGGRAGNTHLSFARRSSRAEAFGEPTALSALDVGIDQRWATFDPDGLGLWFQAVEPTDAGDTIRIWRTRRPNQASSDFALPNLFTVPLQDPIVGSPTVTRSGSTLYFVSGAPALHLRRVPLQPQLGAAVSLDELATGISENTPVPTSADVGLYYARHTASRDEIWFAQRASTSDRYTKIAAVDELNQGSLNMPVWLSPDDCRLYFVSNRGGTYRIYVAAKGR